MSPNEEQKERARGCSRKARSFAFGLPERTHGADVYSTDMILTPQKDGTYRANGEKYYIGNANAARMVSTFGKIAGTSEYVFFVADSQRPEFELIKNVVNSQSYVANFALRDYPVRESDILHRGEDAWNAALNTGEHRQVQPRLASIGICTHALYEAITHAAKRRLYNMHVTDFSHVRQMFVDAYCRLVAHEALRAPGGRLHAQRLRRGPPLSPLQPGREDEGHDAGRRGDQSHVGTRSPRAASKKTRTSKWPHATFGGCRSSREPSTSTSR
jgi:acyl-CoA dehydrogenase